MRALAALILVTAAGCGQPRHEPPAPATPSSPSPTPEETLPPPTAQAPIPPPTLVRRPPSAPPSRGARAEEHGCAVAGATRVVLPGLAAPAIVGLPSGHAIAATIAAEGSVATAMLVVDGRSVRELLRAPMNAPLPPTQIVPPGLARIADSRLALATIEASRSLHYREVDLGTGVATAPMILAESGADPRFPPAIAVHGAERFVAYTKLGDPQRVEVVVTSGTAVLRRHDVTPPSGGAVSPAFVPDLAPPVLVSVDPRAAVSLAHQTGFDAQGRPGPDRSLQPILGLAAPARLVAVRGATDVELFFLAYGEPSGIGIYRVAADANVITPSVVVPASSPGRPWVDALGTEFGAIVAATVPRAGAPALREVVVRLLDSAGLGPELRLPGTRLDLTAIYPTTARDDAGKLLLANGSAAGLELTNLVCAGR